ncbi:MAG TPA: 4Fe-4S dicluster domain-containing protein [Myxococcota bacterium]|nr:4Fe-4S dicluster domain-containing protein [Myxococcota bacterium]
MPNLNRRDFLKALGVTGGASALSACGVVDQNMYSTPVEHILPYVVKPDQVTPGTYTFFATSVTRGPHAVPVTARHRDGRVTFVSANFGTKDTKPPTHPQVPPAALFELQKHYSPDRLKGPSQAGAAKSWDDALAALSTAVKDAVAGGKKVAYVGGYKSGAIVELLQAFTGGNAVFWEPAGYAALAKAVEGLFGRRVLPDYKLDKATFVLSFGAPFLSGWGNPDNEGRFADARNPNIGASVARFALVAPHRDQSGAKADDFLACTPGSEVVVARAVAALVAERKGASDAVRAVIGAVTADEASKASGIPTEQIQKIAEHFASGVGVALPGGATGSTDLAAATLLINVAAGTPAFDLGGYAGPVSDFSAVEQLLQEMSSGTIGVLLVDDVDLAYALPARMNVAAAIKAVPTVVSLSSHPSDTIPAGSAGWSLPVSDVFEDWGDEEPTQSLRILRQPAMAPLYDTRSLGDVLLAVGRAAGLTATGGLGFAPQTWRDYVAQSWQASAPPDVAFADVWERSLQAGFAVRAPASDPAPALTATAWSFAPAAPSGSGDLYLHVHTHPFRQDGRYANQPWAQEVADPMTGQVWGSWLEIHPDKAEELGLSYNDEVELTTEVGSVKLGVVPYRGLGKDVVALALGQGHAASGRYADKYGVNAFALLPGTRDPAGATALGPIKASLRKTGATSGLITTFSIYGMSDEGRHFGVHVDAEKLAKVGDAEAHHVGELTGIHGLELDDRLREQKISDFYGLPDHPTYRFGLTVDTNACNGCGACSVACYAENNLPIVGPKKVAEGREMAWIRVNRYWEQNVGGQDDIRFVPMMCQQCGHAGCENVCPVLATYHNIDGLNAMVYNRCVGTRYCSNACPYSVRRFNYHTYLWPEPFNLQLNPDVTTRQMGVMEKCTFCVQRIRQVKSAFKDGGNFTRVVPSEVWESVPACVEACPSQALTFGNLKDENSKVSKARKSARAYWPLEDLNTFPAVTYLAKASFHDDPQAHHGGGHEAGHEAASEGHGSNPAAHEAEGGH